MNLPNNRALVERIRAMNQRGSQPAEMLKVLSDAGLSVPEMMSHFREAFGLSFDHVSCIGGWFPDGTGELSDRASNRLLERAIREVLETLDQDRKG